LGLRAEDFDQLRFVYLRKEKSVLKKHLQLPTFGGVNRPNDQIAYTLQHFDRFDKMFREMADVIIEVDNRPPTEIADQIQSLCLD
jgi:hypothetical protein